ncbi:MAG: hypothetical protein ABJA02_16740 [Acidobacteriota bacterium]
MVFRWEQFKGGPSKARGTEIRVTIGQKNAIYLNRVAYREFGEPPAVLLFFERNENLIGLVPAKLENKEAFPIKVNGGSTFMIPAAPFCRHFGIRVRGTERFEEPFIDDDGVFRLDLRRTHSVANVIGGPALPHVPDDQATP